MVSREDGPVTVEASVYDPDHLARLTFDWRPSDAGLIDTDESPSRFVFEPAALAPGIYRLQLQVSDNGEPALSDLEEIDIEASLLWRDLERSVRAATVLMAKSEGYDIVLVDDSSQDHTARLARDLGLHVYEHVRNLGYGGNQKSCYRLALQRGADIVVMRHPEAANRVRALIQGLMES